MAEQTLQTFKSHTKNVPLFHFVALPILLLNWDFRFACWMAPLYTRIAADRTETSFVAQSFSSRGRHLSPRRRATGWSPCFQGIPQTPLHTCALSSPGGLRCTRPRVSLPAPAAPRSSRSISPKSRRFRCPSASRSQ